ncbi:hypothetical protein D9M72_558560 [compost metagenome]
MAVVQVRAERGGIEFIREALPRGDGPGPDAGSSVHLRAVDSMEVDRVRVRPCIGEVNPQSIPLLRPERRARNPAVVAPPRERHAGGDLELLVHRNDVPFTQRPAVGQRAGLAPIEVMQDRGGIDAGTLGKDRPAREAGMPGMADAGTNA